MLYYWLKPLVPRSVQILIRRQIVLRKRQLYSNVWPIDPSAAESPEGWTGWPEKKRFALVLTHDVDTTKGQERCYQLAELEREMGFRSSFNFVPRGYDVSADLRHHLDCGGFEVGVHGLNHDGYLYRSRDIFDKRASSINYYLNEWKAVGFRSPAMHHNLDWIHDLDIKYDASTFDTDPFEPQPESVGTIFPFWVDGGSTCTGYVELPYTLPQDFTLYVLMREETIDIWRKKLDWIATKGGMALLNTHPDYMNFQGEKTTVDEYPEWYYRKLLYYIQKRYHGQYWHVLPRDMSLFWSTNMVTKGDTTSPSVLSHKKLAS